MCEKWIDESIYGIVIYYSAPHYYRVCTRVECFSFFFVVRFSFAFKQNASFKGRDEANPFFLHIFIFFYPFAVTHIRHRMNATSRSAPNARGYGMGDSIPRRDFVDETAFAQTAQARFASAAPPPASSTMTTDAIFNSTVTEATPMHVRTMPNVPIGPETNDEPEVFHGGNAQDGLSTRPNGPTPNARLVRALRESRYEEALLAIDDGADIDSVVGKNGENFLTLAAAAGDVHVIDMLQKSGANMKHRNRFGRTALMKAAAWGYPDAAAMLLSFDADVFERDATGKTAVDWSRLSGSEACRRVVEGEALRRIKLMRMAHLTAERENEIVYLLRANSVLSGNIMQALDERAPSTLVDVLKSASFPRAAFDEAVRYSGKEATFYVDAQTRAGWTPMTFACSTAAMELVRALVKNDVMVDLETKRGHTALTWACTCGHENVVAELLELGASLTLQTQKEGKSALMHACYNGHAHVAMRLVDAALAWALRQRRKLVRDAGIGELEFEKAEILKDWSAYFEEWLIAKDNRGKRAIDYALEQGHEHVVTVLEEAESRVAVRKEYMEREYEKAKPTPCRFNCGFVDRADRIVRHETWDCEHRYIDCELGCGMKIQASASKVHYEHDCANRIVPCANAYIGCNEMLKASQKKLHEEHQCLKRFVQCRLGCDDKIRYDERNEHEMSRCKLRCVPCDLGCGQHMQQRTLHHHMKYACCKRPVKCRLGCGLTVEFENLEHHEKHVCARPCKWEGCSEVIGPLDKRTIHEKHFCGFRPIPCPLGCGVTILANQSEDHCAHECPRRLVPCVLGCGEQVPFCEMEAHTVGERGTCPKRILRCRFDCVGKRLRIAFDQNEEGREQREGDELPSGRHIVVAEAYEPSETVPFKVRLGKKVFPCALTDFKSVDVVDEGAWMCGPIEARNRADHEANECPHRLVQCPLGCGQAMPVRFVDAHVAEKCPLRITECSLGCGAKMKEKNRNAHELNHCERRLVKCACNVYIPMHQLEEHAMRECAAATIRCVLGCSKYVVRSEMDAHTANECPKRFVDCKFGCGIKNMWAEEQERHELHECVKRILPCPLACGVCMPADAIDEHVEKICPEKVVECECGESMERKDIQEHKKWWCTHRFVRCVRCGERVKEYELDQHENETCARRIILCKSGCGTAIRLDLEAEHNEKVCPRRIVPCPNGCDDVIRAEELEAHLVVCDHRVIPCGAGSKACARQLKNWVTGDVFSGLGRCVMCEAHGETALMWAASKGEVEVARKIYMYAGGANLDHESKNGYTALTRAAFRGKVNMVEYLIDEGADPNRESSRGQTALLEAIRRGHFNVVRYLMGKRVLIDINNRHGMNPLVLCKQMKNMKMYNELDFGARFHEEQRKLFSAIIMWDYDAVDVITKSGARHVLDHHNLLKLEQKKLREEADDITIDIDALTAEVDARRPKVEELMRSHNASMLEADKVLAKAEELKKRTSHLLQFTLEEAVKDATVALQSVRSNHINMLAEVSKPTNAMRNIMTAVCLMLDVAPVRRKHPSIAFKTIADYWETGRGLLQNGKKLMHRLLHSMRGVVPSEMVRKVRHEFMYDPQFRYACSGEDDEDGYLMLEALSKWAKAVDAYDHVTRTVAPLRMAESKHRVEYNKMMLIIHDKEDTMNGHKKRLAEYEEALADATADIAEVEAKLSKVEKQLWVAELLSYKTVGGHTALSWAAALGNEDIVHLLIDRGASIDYDDSFVHECVVLVQIVWRAYYRRRTRPPWTRERSRQIQLENLGYKFQLLTKVKRIKALRKLSRSPIAEAIYNGNLKVVKALASRGCSLRRRHALYPVGPPPRPFPSLSRDYNDSLRLGNTPTMVMDQNPGVVEIAEMAVRDFKCSRWVYGVGWTHDSEHEETLEYVRQLWAYSEDERIEALESDRASQARYREYMRVKSLNERMADAIIVREDFNEVVELVKEGAQIDYQTKHGYTALTYAAFRGTKLVNRDGDEVYAVELLLDREFKLPAIDRETGRKHTALTLAAKTGRLEIMEILIERGADIEYETRDGKTALMHAAIAGKWDAVRFLVERGARVDHADMQGRTAIEWARDSNFLGVMRTLAEYRYGYYGNVRASRVARRRCLRARGDAARSSKSRS